MGNVKVGNFPIQTGPDFMPEMGQNRGLSRFQDEMKLGRSAPVVVGRSWGVGRSTRWRSGGDPRARPIYPGVDQVTRGWFRGTKSWVAMWGSGRVGANKTPKLRRYRGSLIGVTGPNQNLMGANRGLYWGTLGALWNLPNML